MRRMNKVGSILQFVGGALGRVATSGLIIGIFLAVVGATPGQYFGEILQHPPALLTSIWLSPGLTIVGLAIIWLSLRYNIWSKKQQVIDDLAEDMAWAVHNLLNRSPTPSTEEMIGTWDVDFNAWCGRVSERLGNRAFFTRADQLHFDVLGIMEPIAVAGHLMALSHLETQLNEKLKRLRDIINWAQERRR
jgi:hypothetical protein